MEDGQCGGTGTHLIIIVRIVLMVRCGSHIRVEFGGMMGVIGLRLSRCSVESTEDIRIVSL